MLLWLNRDEKEVIEGLHVLREMKRDRAFPSEILKLREEIEDLKIAKSRLTEEHAREDRELRHMIGLEKKRQEVEVEQATKSAVLAVQEENLAADRKRFADEMAFQRSRFEEEVGYLKGMMADIRARLPNVNVALEGKMRR